MQDIEHELKQVKTLADVVDHSKDKVCATHVKNGDIGFGMDALDFKCIEAEIDVVELRRQHDILKSELPPSHVPLFVGKAIVASTFVEPRLESPIRAPLQTATTNFGDRAIVNTDGLPTSHFAKTIANASLSRQAFVPSIPAEVLPREFPPYWGKDTHWLDEIQNSVSKARCDKWDRVKDKDVLQSHAKAREADGSALDLDMQVLQGTSFNSSRHHHATTMSSELKNVSSLRRCDRIRVLESLIRDTDEQHRHLEQNQCEEPDACLARDDLNRFCYAGPKELSKLLERNAVRNVNASKPTTLAARRMKREEEDDRGDSRTFTCLSEMAKLIASGELDPDRLARLGHTLELRAYELRPNDALRAIGLIFEGTQQISVAGHEYARQCAAEDHRAVIGIERTVCTMRNSARKIMAAVSAQLQQGLWEKNFFNAGQWGTPRFCADALMTMAITKSGEQAQLDSLLAQLLLLLRRDPLAFSPPILATMARSLVKLQKDSGINGNAISARSGTDKFHTMANLSFLNTFNGCLSRRMSDFTRAETIDVRAYLSLCTSEEQRQHLSLNA